MFIEYYAIVSCPILMPMLGQDPRLVSTLFSCKFSLLLNFISILKTRPKTGYFKDPRLNARPRPKTGYFKDNITCTFNEYEMGKLVLLIEIIKLVT